VWSSAARSANWGRPWGGAPMWRLFAALMIGA